MFERYRRILSLPGTLAFSSAGLVARLPISMVGLGIVLLVSAQTGSYGRAGTISAAAVIANAVGSPLQGRLTDRFGQHRVLPALAAVFAVGITATTVSVGDGWGLPLPHLCAAVTGFALPQIGSMVRARWGHAVADRSLLQTAFALEAVVDEIIFIVGPVLVTYLATAVHPFAGLASAGAAGAVGAVVLSAQRGTEPAVGGTTHHGLVRRPLDRRLLVPLVLSSVGLGAQFGALEVVTVAVAGEHDARGLAGALLASFAAGSMLAGVVLGAMSRGARPVVQYRVMTTFLLLAFVPLTFGGPLPLAAFWLFLCGLAISPSLVASISLVERAVPRQRLTEGIAWVNTGIAVGVAPGAAVSGWAVDAYGASSSYLVCVVSAALSAAVAWSLRDPTVADPVRSR